MRRQNAPFLRMTLIGLSWCCLTIATAYANTTIALERAAHFTTAEGSDVVLDPGAYTLEAAEEWIRVIPDHHRTAAWLLEAHRTRHAEALD
jgi:hypothetical protein